MEQWPSLTGKVPQRRYLSKLQGQWHRGKLDLPTEGAKPKWAILFNGNQLSARGVNLSYVAPTTKNGEKVVELNKDEVEKATEEWKQAIIFYVVGDSPTIATIERYIALYVNC